MPKSTVRSYSRYTEEALTLLAKLIRASRLEKKMSAQEVADRAGISRGMLSRIEKADPIDLSKIPSVKAPSSSKLKENSIDR